MGGCEQKEWNTFRMNAILTLVFLILIDKEIRELTNKLINKF